MLWAPLAIIGASLSEPHIDELNVRNLFYFFIMVRTSPVRRSTHYYNTIAIAIAGRMNKSMRAAA